MGQKSQGGQPFNILIIGQAGRLQYEALLFAASLRANAPAFQGRLIVAEPQPGPLWDKDPRISPDLRAGLADLGAGIVPFESAHFGQAYPYGNKIEGLAALPAGEPFVFFDTDTLVTGDLAAVPRFDMTVVKSPLCQPQFFNDGAELVLNIDAPGSTSANLLSLGHTRCARPLYPLDPDCPFVLEPRIFSRSQWR